MRSAAATSATAASAVACVLAAPPRHATACLTIKADPPGSPKQTGLYIQHTPDHIMLYSCVHCLFDITQSLRGEGYVNIRVLGGIYS